MAQVPKWPELCVKNLFSGIIAEHAELKKYFPDYTGALKLPSRQYFWRVVKTLCPVYYKDLVDSALKNRQIADDKSKQSKTIIDIKSSWIEKLRTAEVLNGKYDDN